MRIIPAIILSILLLSACNTTQPAAPIVISQPALTVTDVAQILSLAVKDIQAQGYEPLFLNESRGYIWVRGKDGSIRLYRLDTLIKAFQDGKAKPAETK